MTISFRDIGKVKLPGDLSEQSDEEKIFESKEVDSHHDHKHLEANKEALELARQRVRELTIRNDDLSRLGPHRRKFSWWILIFSASFVVCTMGIVLLSSYQVPINESEYSTPIKLDDSVLITLLATNTVQVVGLLYVVAKWLFPSIDVNNKSK